MHGGGRDDTDSVDRVPMGDDGAQRSTFDHHSLQAATQQFESDLIDLEQPSGSARLVFVEDQSDATGVHCRQQCIDMCVLWIDYQYVGSYGCSGFYHAEKERGPFLDVKGFRTRRPPLHRAVDRSFIG